MSDQPQLSPTPILPSALQAAVEAHLIGMGWKYTVEPSAAGTTSIARLWIPQLNFELEYSTHQNLGRVVLQLVPDIVIYHNHRGEVALLLCWVNAYLQCTTFHLVPGRSELRLRICLAGDLDQQVDADTLLRITELAIAIATRFCPIIREVARGKATAEQMLPRLASPRT
jgi:hypothetical protein